MRVIPSATKRGVVKDNFSHEKLSLTKHIVDGLQKQISPQVLQSIASTLGVPYDDLMAAGCIDVPVTEVAGVTVTGINEVVI